MSNAVVFYHKNCNDGFGAAYLIWKYLDKDAEFIPLTYDNGINIDMVKDKIVYILDFSFSEKIMSYLLDKASKVYWFDHHKSAEELALSLENPKLTTIFDLARSGIGITADYLSKIHGTDYRGWIVDYIEDRDLWQWKWPTSKAVNAALASLPHNFEEWDKYFDTHMLGDTQQEGEAILRYQQRILEHHLNNIEYIETVFGEIPVLNATTLTSEIGNYLCNIKGYLMSISYRIDGDRITYSLRSDNKIDVSKVAQKIGKNGGGHKNAAGVTVIGDINPVDFIVETLRS